MLKSPVIHSTHPAYSVITYDVETGLWAAAKGVFPIGDLITHRFRFEDIDEAFEVLASNPQGYIKGIVTID